MAPLSPELLQDSLSSLNVDDEEEPCRPRKVSFAVDVAVHEIEQLSDYTEEGRKDAWFQECEYNLIENVNTELVLSFQNDRDSSGPRSYHTTVEVVYSSCLDSNDGPSQDDLDRLDAWVRNCNLLRGLESESLPGLANKRRKRKDAVLRSVIHLQFKISDVLYSVDERAEMIRDASEKLSQPSKEFARIMGLADQSAAKDERRRPEAKRMTRSWRTMRSVRSMASSSPPPTRTCLPPPPPLKRVCKSNLMERLGVRRSQWSAKRKTES
jgi:hypothetical protein